MTLWTVEHRVFGCDSFVRSGESVTEFQYFFYRIFNVLHHGVYVVHGGDSLMKKMPPGQLRTVRTLENVEYRKQATLRSSRFQLVGILQHYNTSARRIFHQDMRFTIL